jgi:hypothetical protein
MKIDNKSRQTGIWTNLDFWTCRKIQDLDRKGWVGWNRMESTNGKGNNESRDTWRTPQNLWGIIHKQYEFDLDCCANIENRKVIAFPSDFLKQDFYGRRMAWMNPPFSKANEMFEHFFKVIKNGVAIYRCDNFETKVWQKIIFPNASWIFIPDKRVAYEGMDGNGSRFPSALIGLNVEIPIGLNGTLLEPKK